MKTDRFLTVGALLSTLLLGACATTYRYDEPVVRIAPPPPYVEYYGSPPVADYVWISGYWNWGGARYVWVPGRWEAPRPGYQWVPHRWERDGDHWRQHGGQWERGGYQEPSRTQRSGHQEVQQPNVPAPRRMVVEPEVPRGERGSGFHGERDVRPPPGNASPPPLHDTVRRVEPQAPVPSRVEPVRVEPRATERNEVRAAPERNRGADANEHGGRHGGRDERGKDDRAKERGGDHNPNSRGEGH